MEEESSELDVIVNTGDLDLLGTESSVWVPAWLEYTFGCSDLFALVRFKNGVPEISKHTRTVDGKLFARSEDELLVSRDLAGCGAKCIMSSECKKSMEELYMTALAALCGYLGTWCSGT